MVRNRRTPMVQTMGVVGFGSEKGGTGRYGVENRSVHAGSSALRLASGLDMRLVELLL